MMSPTPKRGPALFRVYLAAARRTQAALAKHVDVSAVTVHHWLHGRLAPRPERREAIAAWSGGAIPAEAWDEPAASWEVAMAAAAILPDRGDVPVEDLPTDERGAA